MNYTGSCLTYEEECFYREMIQGCIIHLSDVGHPGDRQQRGKMKQRNRKKVRAVEVSRFNLIQLTFIEPLGEAYPQISKSVRKVAKGINGKRDV